MSGGGLFGLGPWPRQDHGPFGPRPNGHYLFFRMLLSFMITRNVHATFMTRNPGIQDASLILCLACYSSNLLQLLS